MYGTLEVWHDSIGDIMVSVNLQSPFILQDQLDVCRMM